jgi:DNA-binding CsgD family transcriptional regulator
MLHNTYLGVLASQSEAEFKRELSRCANNLGFGTFDALMVKDGPSGTQFTNVTNIESPYWYSIDPDLGRRDPVMQHCKTRSIPIVWGSRQYRSSEVAEIYELLGAFGLRSGISVCSHLGEGLHFALSLHTDRDLGINGIQVAHALEHLQLLTAHALDAACRLYLPAASPGVEELARDEVDLLSWVLNGKSNDEIAALLNINLENLANRTARLVRGLDCTNEHQAALKAFRLGIIR